MDLNEIEYRRRWAEQEANSRTNDLATLWAQLGSAWQAIESLTKAHQACLSKEAEGEPAQVKGTRTTEGGE